MAKKFVWHKIAESIADIICNENNLCELEIADKKICISKNKNTLLACAAKCPHAGGRLAEGYIDALGNIVCPLHRYKFSLQNGRNISGEGYFLKTYPIEIRSDGVFVSMEENKSFF